MLAGTKIIAEAWDAAGLYQVGSFTGHRWAEWNGSSGMTSGGSSGAIWAWSRRCLRASTAAPTCTQPDREPNRSINFITSHDGFTLNDLVSYNNKHNEANLEQNRDGSTPNNSWNCGVEGPTDNPHIEALRQRQIRNLLTILFVSQGTL